MTKTENILRLPIVILIFAYIAFTLGRNDTQIVDTFRAVYTYVSSLGTSTQEPVAKNVDPRELKCLADNIYYEAGNQSDLGKIAVARVVMNRAEEASGRFPTSVCGVVYQKIKTTCQFSWVCAHKRPAVNTELYDAGKEIAYKILAYDSFKEGFRDIMFYHADYVNPGWGKRLKQVLRIDNHIFYTYKD